MFKPSIFQEDIFDKIRNGTTNIVINAVAGSGKTSTIVKAIELIPDTKKILFIAFNKDIVDELNKRIGSLSNIHIATYHSLGSSILRESNRGNNCELDIYKYENYIRNNINTLTTLDLTSIDKSEYILYINNIISLLNYSRFNLAQSNKEINNIAIKYGVNVQYDEVDICIKVMEWGLNNTNIIDYTDMIWIPVENDFITRKYKFDWLFIDEAQDSSIMQQQLISKCFNRGAHFCAVGDTHQCINAWAGADINAFNNFINKSNTISLKLPITYRCPKKIVELAQNFVPEIEASSTAIDGEINYDVNINKPTNGDMVLCRNTEPLIRLYSQYLRNNKKCYIKGRDIGTSLIKLINDTNMVELNKTMVDKGVFSELYRKLFKLQDNYIIKYNIPIEETLSIPQIYNLYEQINSLMVLSENITDKTILIEKIESIFIDNDTDGICLSTIHKSKGLEANNIFILCPSLIPSKLSKTEWEIIGERNLEYVAITRAKKTLNYLSEKYFNPHVYNNTNQTLKNLGEIEVQIGYNRYVNDTTFIKNDVNTPKINNDVKAGNITTKTPYKNIMSRMLKKNTTK